MLTRLMTLGAVFPWSNVAGGFAPPKLVRVTVR